MCQLTNPVTVKTILGQIRNEGRKITSQRSYLFSQLPNYEALYIPPGLYVYRILRRSLSDLNECLEANRPNCTNGTTCINTWGSAECVCPGNRYGSACQYCKYGRVTHIHSSDRKIAKIAILNFSATIYVNARFMVFTILIYNYFYNYFLLVLNLMRSFMVNCIFSKKRYSK